MNVSMLCYGTCYGTCMTVVATLRWIGSLSEGFYFDCCKSGFVFDERSGKRIVSTIDCRYPSYGPDTVAAGQEGSRRPNCLCKSEPRVLLDT